ncbi:MAG: SdpI family protein, partial [Pseudonocardiaceae bacterium]
SRDRGTGVRTAATLRSDEAFALGNKVAGLPTMVAGAVGITAGIAALLMPSALGAVMAATMGVFGIGLLVGAGGLLGHRAAATMPQSPKPTGHAGCGGCACGGGGCGS